VIVGGLDFNVNRNVVGGMEAFGAVCTRPDLLQHPESSVRPFDAKRSGTGMADGGSALVLQSE